MNGHIDGLMSGLATRYDLGSERDEVGRLIGDRLVGEADRQAPLFAQMAHGEGMVLDASPDGRAAGIAAGFRHVRCVTAAGGPSLLIRPDGCIAWAGDAGDMAGLADALARWFAPAAPQGAFSRA